MPKQCAVPFSGNELAFEVTGGALCSSACCILQPDKLNKFYVHVKAASQHRQSNPSGMQHLQSEHTR
jgi:hypothetical protein